MPRPSIPRPSRPSRSASRFTRLFAPLAAAGLLLAGCGGGDTGASAGSPRPAAPAGGAFPATVTHKYGSTTVTGADRIVTLGLSDHEIVLALGAKPVGAVDWFGERPFGAFPWQSARWKGTTPEIVGVRDEYDVEKIVALKPDLIIAQYSGMTREQYQTLSQFAPVVAQPAKYPDYAAPWQEMTLAVGRAMGRQAQAQALVDGVQAKFATVRAKYPQFKGKTVVVADAYQPGTFSAFNTSDPKTVFFHELGFTSPESITSAPAAQTIIDVGAEGLERFEADRLVWLTSDQGSQDRVKAEPLYRQLDVVKRGDDLFVPYAQPPAGAAMAFGTVLSLPYAIDSIVPLIAGER